MHCKCESALCFGNSTIKNGLSRIQVQSEELDKKDAKGEYRRGRELNKWGANSRREDRPTMFFPVTGPNDEDVYPIRNDGKEGCWRLGKKKMFDIVEKGDADFVKRADETYIVYEKIRSTDPRTKPYRTYLTDTGTTADGSKAVKELFEGDKVFDFAKPVKLLKQLISLGTDGDEIVMDFFAGSGSTAQAVMELNYEEDLNLKYMCVQLPETIPSSHHAYSLGYRTITELTKERLRRVSKQLSTNIQSETKEGKLFEDEGVNISDTVVDGFKVYALTQSNFRVYQPHTGTNTQQLTMSFQQMTDKPLVDGWTKLDLTTELMLLEGFPLHSSQTPQPQYTENEVLAIASDFNDNTLYLCLDPQLQDETVENLAIGPDDVFICLDAALTDIQKIRLDDKLKLKTV